MIDRVFIDGEEVFATDQAGEAMTFARQVASRDGVECIVSLDNGAYGFRIEFLYENDLAEVLS